MVDSYTAGYYSAMVLLEFILPIANVVLLYLILRRLKKEDERR